MSVSNGKCPQGGCSGEGEYTTQGSQKEDLTLNEATIYSSRRRNSTIQPKRCIQPNANASNNAILFWQISRMMVSRTRITTTVFLSLFAAPAQSGAFPNKVRIQCLREKPEFNMATTQPRTLHYPHNVSRDLL